MGSSGKRLENDEMEIQRILQCNVLTGVMLEFCLVINLMVTHNGITLDTERVGIE